MRMKALHPEAAVLVHPESPQAIVEMADAVGSTSQLIAAAKSLPQRQLIVATDRGIFYKMQQAVPEKTLLEAPTAGEGATCRSCAHCPWMAMNGLKAIAEGLEQGGAEHEIHVDEALRTGALIPLTGCWILRLHYGDNLLSRRQTLRGGNGFFSTQNILVHIPIGAGGTISPDRGRGDDCRAVVYLAGEPGEDQ